MGYFISKEFEQPTITTGFFLVVSLVVTLEVAWVAWVAWDAKGNLLPLFWVAWLWLSLKGNLDCTLGLVFALAGALLVGTFGGGGVFCFLFGAGAPPRLP